MASDEEYFSQIAGGLQGQPDQVQESDDAYFNSLVQDPGLLHSAPAQVTGALGGETFTEALGSFELADFAKVAINALPSMMENTAGVASAFLNPLDTVSSLAQLASGVQKVYAGAPEDEDTKAARETWEGMKALHTTNLREFAVEDPAGLMLELVSFMPGAAAAHAGKLGRIPQAVSKVARLPETLPLMPVKAALKAPEVFGKYIGPSVFSMQTGKDPVAIRQIFEAGQEGSRGKELATQALRGQYDLKQVVPTVRQAKDAIGKQRASEYEALMAKVDRSQTFDMDGLRQDIERWMSDTEEWGVRIRYDARTKKPIRDKYGRVEVSFTSSKEPTTNLSDASQKRIRTVVNELLDPRYDGGTVAALDDLTQRLGGLRGTTPQLRQSRAFINQLRERIQASSLDRVKGLGPAKRSYAQWSSVINDMEKILSESSDNPEVILRKIIGASQSEHAALNLRRDLLKIVDAKAKTHLLDISSGAALSEILPTGIHARGILLQGLAPGALGAFVNPVFFLGLPFVSPRVVGEFMRAMGIGARWSDRVRSFVEKIRLARPTRAGRGGTVNFEALASRGASIMTVLNTMKEAGYELPQAPLVPVKDPSARRRDTGAPISETPTKDPEAVSARVLGGPTPEDDPSMLVPLPFEVSEGMAWSERFRVLTSNFLPSAQNFAFRSTEGVRALSELSGDEAVAIGKELGGQAKDYAYDHKILGGPLTPEGQAFAMSVSDAVDNYLDTDRIWNDPFTALIDGVDIITFGSMGASATVAGVVAGRVNKMDRLLTGVRNARSKARAAKSPDELQEAVTGLSEAYSELTKNTIGVRKSKIAQERLNDRLVGMGKRDLIQATVDIGEDLQLRGDEARHWGLYKLSDEVYHMPLPGDPILPHGLVEDALATAFDSWGNPSKAQLRKSFEYFYGIHGQAVPASVKRAIGSKAFTQAQMDGVLARALAEAPESARTWYRDMAVLAEDLVGAPNMNEWRGIFALTSTQNPVESNLADTLTVMRLAREHLDANNGKFRRQKFEQELWEHTKKGGGKKRQDVSVAQRIAPTKAQLRRDPLADVVFSEKTGKTRLTGLIDPYEDETRLVSSRALFVDRTAIKRIGEFYESGTFIGNPKTRTYNMTFATRGESGNAFFPFTVNDTHIAKFFDQVGKDGKYAFGNDDAYRVAQYTIARSAQKLGMNADEAQALFWWYAKKYLTKTDPSSAQVGAFWRHNLGEPLSAGEFSRYAADELEPWLDRTKPIFPGFTNKIPASSTAVVTESFVDIAQRLKESRSFIPIASKHGAFGVTGVDAPNITVLREFHKKLWDRISSDGGTKIRALEELEPILGFKHRVVPETYGTWEGIEPNYSVMIDAGNDETVEFIASIMGEAFDQQAAVWSIEAPIDIRELAKLRAAGDEIHGFGVTLRKRDGSEFSLDELEQIRRSLPKRGDGDYNFGQTPVKTEVRFLNFHNWSRVDDQDFLRDIGDLGRKLKAEGLDVQFPIPFTQRGGLLGRGSYRSSIERVWNENGLAGRSDIPERILGDLSEQYRKTYDEFFRKGSFEQPYEDLPPIAADD